MGRRYAVREDTGERVLVEISCDHCGKTVKPDIVTQGWRKVGWDNGVVKHERFVCPDDILKESER